jgi:hypothetical protein
MKALSSLEIWNSTSAFFLYEKNHSLSDICSCSQKAHRSLGPGTDWDGNGEPIRNRSWLDRDLNHWFRHSNKKCTLRNYGTLSKNQKKHGMKKLRKVSPENKKIWSICDLRTLLQWSMIQPLPFSISIVRLHNRVIK